MSDLPKLPTHFNRQEWYDQWIDEHAEHEAEEFVSYHEDTVVIPEDVNVWVHQSPAVTASSLDWARLYSNVRAYGHSSMISHTIEIPEDNVVEATAQAVAHAVHEDIYRETLDELREDDRVEVRGP